jgi:flagellar basal body-associated protein FliL
VVTKSKLAVLALICVFLFSLSVVSVGALVSTYTTEKTTNVTISSAGTFAATEPSVGASYKIVGTPGATGTVTATVYEGNPQPTANVPSGVSLTYFIAISININAHDFIQATITLNYTDSTVQNIKAPYMVYKFNSASNKYVGLTSTANTREKTITVTLNSLTDPLLAIGGAKTASGGVPASTWIITVIAVVIIVSVNVFVFYRMRHEPETETEPAETLKR